MKQIPVRVSTKIGCNTFYKNEHNHPTFMEVITLYNLVDDLRCSQIPTSRFSPKPFFHFISESILSSAMHANPVLAHFSLYGSACGLKFEPYIPLPKQHKYCTVLN